MYVRNDLMMVMVILRNLGKIKIKLEKQTNMWINRSIINIYMQKKYLQKGSKLIAIFYLSNFEFKEKINDFMNV